LDADPGELLRVYSAKEVWDEVQGEGRERADVFIYLDPIGLVLLGSSRVITAPGLKMVHSCFA